jgi:ribosomal protein L9
MRSLDIAESPLSNHLAELGLSGRHVPAKTGYAAYYAIRESKAQQLPEAAGRSPERRLNALRYRLLQDLNHYRSGIWR